MRVEFKFKDNLTEFIRRMVEVEGFEIRSFFPYYEGRSFDLFQYKNIEKNDYDEIAYQGLNFEHTNLEFYHPTNKYYQVVSIMLTGDDYCDLIPINDWSFNSKHEDIVDKTINSMTTELTNREV
tara:strand:+ start:4152 stop:4523 length:372 start_codon:yes stop_codon:yes gene_type:complete